MNEHDIAEQAYKNGYEKGKRDAVKQCKAIFEYVESAIHIRNDRLVEYPTEESHNRAFQAELDRLHNAVKHGRWIDGVCSNCKEEAISRSWDEPIYDYDWEENLRYSYTETHTEYQLTDYCPNCGANMKGE